MVHEREKKKNMINANLDPDEKFQKEILKSITFGSEKKNTQIIP